MSNMNFNCDVCGREVQGYTFVNGMKFCAKCYQETFGETEKDRKISELQSQLAEKDKEIDKLTSKLEQANEIINNPDTLIFQQQELIDNLQKTIEEKNKEQNQKAIEQLEKVNGVLTDTIIEVTANEFDIDKLCYLEEISARFYDKMQQQINELKGEK